MSRKKRKEGFGVGQCSLCEHYALTLGQQDHGGIRWCRECFRSSLAYVQLTDEQRTRIMNIWQGTEQDPRIQALLEQAKSVTPDQRKANSIGESRWRLAMSERID